MRLCSFRTAPDRPVLPGMVEDGSVVDLAAAGYTDSLQVISSGSALRISPGLPRHNLEAVTLLAPLSNPPRIFCAGLNYRDHAAESNLPLPEKPTIFMKLPSAIIGPEESVVVPVAATKEPDYEAELAIVIGRAGYRVAAGSADDFIFGYTILNDVSARDVQLSTSQWTLGKSLPTFAPLGPVIVSRDELPHPDRLDIKLTIGGEVLQHSNTRELIFTIPALVSYISAYVALQPGDIISTGTPAGVGLGRTPRRWLRGGDTMVIDVEGIGSLRNPVRLVD